MAKFPKWTADLVPTGGGPLIVRQPNAGQAGAALSGLGRSMARYGQYLTQEAKEAAERTQELDRIRQASTATRQASQELRKFADEIRRDPDPGNYERRFEEVSQSVLSGVDAIEDTEVKTRVQTQIDADLDWHYRDMLTHRMEAQQKAFESEYTAAEDQAIRTGDVELAEKPLKDLQAVGLLSEGQASEYLAKTRAKTLVWQTALALGWKEGQEYIADPQTWKDVPLSLEEMQAFKGLIESNLQSQQAIEARNARLQAAKIEQAKSTLFADALAGKLDDPATIDAALRSGTITPPEAKELYKVFRNGPAEVSDPDVYLEALNRVDMAQRDPAKRAEALAYLRRNATKLTPAKYESLSAQAYSTDAPDNPLSAPVVKLLNGLIDDTYTNGGFGEWGTPDAQTQYINAKERFIAFVQANPDADDESLNQKYRQLVEPIARPTWLGRIRDWFLTPGTLTGSLLNPQPIDAETPPVTFQQADETATPESLEEFERVLMSLPNGSKAQKDYYEKWADRWR